MSAPEPEQKTEEGVKYDAEHLKFLTDAAVEADDASTCVTLTGMSDKEMFATLFGE